jgi:hypothetical protein
MTTPQTEALIAHLKSKGIHFDNGLTEQEALQVEQKFDLTFPPDLRLFLQTAIPVSKGFYNWRKNLDSKKEAGELNLMLARPTFETFRLTVPNKQYSKRLKYGNIKRRH